MRGIKRAVALAAVIIPLSAAHAVDYRWTTGFAHGTVEAIIKNENGSGVDIYCPAGQTDTTPGMFIETDKVRPRPNEQIDVQIIVDGRNYPFYLREIQFKAEGRQNLNDLYALIDALAKSGNKSFSVEFPKFGMA